MMKAAVLQLTALTTDLVVLALDVVVTVWRGVGGDCIPGRGAMLQPYKVQTKLNTDPQVCRVGTSKSPLGGCYRHADCKDCRKCRLAHQGASTDAAVWIRDCAVDPHGLNVSLQMQVQML